MVRPAKGVEALRLGIGIFRQVVDLGDTSPPQPGSDIGGKIELEVARPSVREELRIICRKGCAKRRVHLVGGLRDGGADRGCDARCISTEGGHLRNCVLDYTAMRAAPAGMCRRNNAGLAVRQQHGCAIGRDDGKQAAGLVGHEGVGFRRGIHWPLIATLDADDIGRMHLREPDRARTGQDCVDATRVAARESVRNPLEQWRG